MKEITAREVEERLLRNEEIHVIDVREVEEVREGKIPGVLHIRLGLLEFRIQELDKNNEYIIFIKLGRKKCKSSSIFRRLRFSSDQYGRWYVSLGR